MADSRRNVFFRIAAILLLVVFIVGVLCDLTYYIFRNVTYSSFIWGRNSVFRNFNFSNLISFLSETVPMIRSVFGAVFALLIVVMLFASKEKVAGKLIIVSSVILYVLYVTSYVLNFIAAQMNNSLSSYLQATVWTLIKNTVMLAVLILFGLLLTGVFKSGSKVFGFILCGMFAVSVIVTLFEFIRAMPSSVYVFQNGDAFYKVATIINRIAQIMGCVRYTAYALCCLGVALKPRESVKTEPEIS